ncbi:MAG: hypothetical protein RLN79_04265 [Cytophagales bacterium]
MENIVNDALIQSENIKEFSDRQLLEMILGTQLHLSRKITYLEFRMRELHGQELGEDDKNVYRDFDKTLEETLSKSESAITRVNEYLERRNVHN